MVYLFRLPFQHYSRMLAKRLIHGQTASMDAEEMMINKLKVRLQPSYTPCSKLGLSLFIVKIIK